MKTTESHYVEKFLCKVFMVFMNSTNMSRFNVSLNQNEFVTPGKTEINCQ